jgi:predicted Fe-Mo cluster-binding NifX family protein
MNFRPFLMWIDMTRIASHADRHILLVDVSQNKEQQRKEEYLPAQNPFEPARWLPKFGVDLLVCGMISQAQQAAISAAGIRIIPCICGSMEEVIAALPQIGLNAANYGCQVAAASRKRFANVSASQAEINPGRRHEDHPNRRRRRKAN